MSIEHTKPGRRSHGEAAHLRRAANAARLLGQPIIRPELPIYLSPKDRLDYDRFIFPALQKLPDETVFQVNQNPGIIQDYISAQWEIFHGKREEVVMTKFREQHPAVGRANMKIMTDLTPALKLIEGRFRQAANASSLQGHPRRFR